MGLGFAPESTAKVLSGHVMHVLLLSVEKALAGMLDTNSFREIIPGQDARQLCRLIGLAVIEAGRANPDVLDAIALYIIPTCVLQQIDGGGNFADLDVVHPAAPLATDVHVRLQVRVVPPLGTTFDPLDRSALGEHLQIAIHRPEADAGQRPPNRLVHVVSGGVGVGRLEFRENQPTLTRHPPTLTSKFILVVAHRNSY